MFVVFCAILAICRFVKELQKATKEQQEKEQAEATKDKPAENKGAEEKKDQ